MGGSQGDRGVARGGCTVVCVWFLAAGSGVKACGEARLGRSMRCSETGQRCRHGKRWREKQQERINPLGHVGSRVGSLVVAGRQSRPGQPAHTCRQKGDPGSSRSAQAPPTRTKIDPPATDSSPNAATAGGYLGRYMGTWVVYSGKDDGWSILCFALCLVLYIGNYAFVCSR